MTDINLHALGEEYQQLRHVTAGKGSDEQQEKKYLVLNTIVEQLGLPGTPAADILSTLGKPDELVPLLQHDASAMMMPGPVMGGSSTAARPPYYFVYYNKGKHDYFYFKIDSVKETLRPFLPQRYRLATRWSLLYSLDQHGISLTTLYRLVKNNKGPCLLAIKDADDQVFGAFLNESLKPGTHYYGTGECFLWRNTTNGLKAYAWTGMNEYMILSEHEFIAIGGGDGKFGLWINGDLDKGYSTSCPTFNNEPLAGQPEFNCIELEIWGFRI
ncbi:hypothetical protein [Absidia glauca]|uniref:Oxidation resistance protein 1 n=1 Tax=Absidia glauca TaxID=4829 RepID=A0A168T724_ABSGL|nr:hypothetical protein [Absidia glauca]